MATDKAKETIKAMDAKNILVIGHSLVIEENRKRWLTLAQLDPQLQVTVLVPNQWQQTWFGKTVTWKPDPYQGPVKNFHVLPVEVTHNSDWARYRIRHLRRILRDRRPDFIFVMQEEFTLCLHWVLLHKLLFAPQAKLLFFSWQNIPITLNKWSKRLLWNFLCAFVDGQLAGTHQIRQVFEQAGFAGPIWVQTEIGVDAETFAPQSELRERMRRELGVENDFVIGFSGRIVREKGVEDLAAACLHLPPHLPSWKLLMVGDGALREKVTEEFRKKGQEHRLICIGEIPVDQTPDYYRAMDCLVLPSRTTPTWKEQFGLVLAQVMMSGVQAIGSDSGAIPEVIQDPSCIFPEGDVAALQRLLQQMIQKGITGPQEQVKARAWHFSIDHLAQSTYEIIRNWTEKV